MPGDIYHVDSIFYERELLFAIASRYGRPPMDVSHEGDIFTTRTLPRGSDEERPLIALNEQVLKAFGLVRGVSHSEFIRGRDDGKLYFLETSARVGGAHIADLVEAATGINLWREWAKIEIAGGKAPYQPPTPGNDSAGLLISLARQENPDTSAYNDPEIVWRMDDKKHHVGLDREVAGSEARGRVDVELRATFSPGLLRLRAAAARSPATEGRFVSPRYDRRLLEAGGFLRKKMPLAMIVAHRAIHASVVCGATLEPARRAVCFRSPSAPR